MSHAFRDLLAASWPLSDGQLSALEAHYELLCRWNKVLNLTRIDRLEEAVERHYGESLFLASHLPAGARSVVDIGSGAGFPGFPVAIARPDCTLTLIESHQRKGAFLKEASRAIPNIRVLSKRAEDVNARFDWAISRAVSFSDLSVSLKRLAPRAALLTGAELPSADLGFEWEDTVPLPSGNARFLIVSRETTASHL